MVLKDRLRKLVGMAHLMRPGRITTDEQFSEHVRTVADAVLGLDPYQGGREVKGNSPNRMETAGVTRAAEARSDAEEG